MNRLMAKQSEDNRSILSAIWRLRKAEVPTVNGEKRSDFNLDKTKLLRPILFRDFENDPSVSFCYSNDPLKENDDSTILYNFSK